MTNDSISSRKILQSVFGFHDFRSPQDEIIDTLVRGNDALVLMPTGGGKSLCYQIPSILREGCGIVISPLIALMQDQVSALQLLGVRAGFLNSTLDSIDTLKVETALKENDLDLLYIAPERLNQTRTLQLLSQSKIALFAIDEAHCVSQWGHDFRSDYLNLSLLHERFPNTPRIALTATADERTKKEILLQEEDQNFMSLLNAELVVLNQDMLDQNFWLTSFLELGEVFIIRPDKNVFGCTSSNVSLEDLIDDLRNQILRK